MDRPDFICYDRWPGPHSKVDTSTVMQIHSSVTGDQLAINYIRDAINRGVVVLPYERYAMEITERR